MWFHYDDRGHYRGHSTGCFASFILFWLGAAGVLLLLGWPLLIHGPAGKILAAIWIPVALIGLVILFNLRSSKGVHRAPGGEAPGAQPSPVYDGDKPASYNPERPPRDERSSSGRNEVSPRGRSVGTKFQS